MSKVILACGELLSSEALEGLEVREAAWQPNSLIRTEETATE